MCTSFKARKTVDGIPAALVIYGSALINIALAKQHLQKVAVRLPLYIMKRRFLMKTLSVASDILKQAWASGILKIALSASYL